MESKKCKRKSALPFTSVCQIQINHNLIPYVFNLIFILLLTNVESYTLMILNHSDLLSDS